MNRLALAVSLLATLIATPALADCDYEAALESRAVAHGFFGSSPGCVVTVSDLECEAEYLNDAECQAKADRLTMACVAEDVCREAAQGWLEDDGVSGESLGDMFGACLDLVAAAGGSGR